MRCPSEPVVNGMSVDVEDYFQVSAFEGVVDRAQWPLFERRVAANTDRILEIFAAAGVRATFFVLGWIAEHEPSVVRRIAEQGHEIGSHGYWHRLVYNQTASEFREDVRRSKALLESIAAQPVIGYRAPSFSITEASLWALDALAEEGFTYDASIFPIRHDRYGIPGAERHPHPVDGNYPGVALTSSRGGLFEIPVSTVRIAGLTLPVSGGGYFRLLPYGWTRWGIRRVNLVEGRSAIFYLHPWELDPDQPRIEAPAISRLRHYRNLHKTGSRLRRLLAEFRFGPIAETISMFSAGRHEAEEPFPAAASAVAGR